MLTSYWSRALIRSKREFESISMIRQFESKRTFYETTLANGEAVHFHTK